MEKSQDSRSAGRDLNPGHLEYESRVSANRLRRSLILSVAQIVKLCLCGCYGIVDWTSEKIARKETATDRILEWEPEGKRMQRRPRQRCVERVRRSMTNRGLV